MPTTAAITAVRRLAASMGADVKLLGTSASLVDPLPSPTGVASDTMIDGCWSAASKPGAARSASPSPTTSGKSESSGSPSGLLGGPPPGAGAAGALAGAADAFTADGGMLGRVTWEGDEVAGSS